MSKQEPPGVDLGLYEGQDTAFHTGDTGRKQSPSMDAIDASRDKYEEDVKVVRSHSRCVYYPKPGKAPRTLGGAIASNEGEQVQVFPNYNDLPSRIGIPNEGYLRFSNEDTFEQKVYVPWHVDAALVHEPTLVLNSNTNDRQRTRHVYTGAREGSVLVVNTPGPEKWPADRHAVPDTAGEWSPEFFEAMLPDDHGFSKIATVDAGPARLEWRYSIDVATSGLCAALVKAEPDLCGISLDDLKSQVRVQFDEDEAAQRVREMERVYDEVEVMEVD